MTGSFPPHRFRLTHTHTHTCSTPFYRGIGEVNNEGIRLVLKMRLGPPQSLSDKGLFPGHGAKAGLHNSTVSIEVMFSLVVNGTLI